MICPLLSAAKMICMFMESDMVPGESLEECNEDDCAWWDTWLSDCSIMAINRELAKINDSLQEK